MKKKNSNVRSNTVCCFTNDDDPLKEHVHCQNNAVNHKGLFSKEVVPANVM
jgi:hypothetical protein